MALIILNAGPLTTVQDLGRLGYERFGVPQSGAMDWFALQVGNRLVGNQPGAAGLEFAVLPPQLRAAEDCLAAGTGSGFILHVNNRRIGAWRCAFVRRGETIHFVEEGIPGWGYLTVSGGVAAPLVMGSRSTYLRGGFGGIAGRTLQPGDVIPTGPADLSGWMKRAGRNFPLHYRIPYASQVIIPVVPGPQDAMFGVHGQTVFFSEEYSISSTSDRMGYRLSGTLVPRVDSGELLSEGIAAGSVQVPPDGQPVVLMSDRPATGGYPKIATVTRAGLPLLAQAMPGFGKVRFHAVSVEEAQDAYRALAAGIEKGLKNNED
jgi:antagonist of KipI